MKAGEEGNSGEFLWCLMPKHICTKSTRAHSQKEKIAKLVNGP